MKKLSLLSVALLIVATNIFAQVVKDQNGNPIPEGKLITTESGLKYIITQQGQGEKAKVGDKVVVHYNGRLLNDTVFDSSVKRGQPFTFALGQGQVIKGWDEAFQILGKGDKAVIILPPHIAYGAQSTGKIPANSTLIFDVELINIERQIQIEQFDTKGKDTLKTSSGLKYIVVDKGKGAKAGVNTNATVHYSGYFLDGRMFDSSVKRNQPFKFEVGAGRVIKGWDEGVALMKEGDKIRFIIPYQIAYGEAGRPPQIPAKSDLIFDVELIKVEAIKQILPYDAKGKDTLKTSSGLKYIIIEKGKGTKATAGAKIKVHYTGFFDDGKIFDSSVKRGEPIELVLGKGQVIKGWDEGLQLMNVGDKFKLLIPYQLAYGDAGRPGAIPPKTNLTFDVELVEVK